MVGIVSGNGVGLLNTSQDILDLTLGQTGAGQANGKAYVNAATGNLSVQFTDETLSGTGADLLALRTYNSLGALNDGDADGWRWQGERRVVLSGTVNTAGSSVTLTAGDGSQRVFSWNGSKYLSQAGSGAHDSLVWNAAGSEWVFNADGANDLIERYSGSTGWIKSSRDSSGNSVDYTFSGNKLTAVKDLQSGQTLQYSYHATNGKLIRIDTRTAAAGALTQQVYFTYDSSLRLSSVSHDLTPSDNSTSDGKVYTTTYTYDGTSTRIAKISQTDGTSVSFTYDTNGRIATVKDQFGTTSFSYDLSSKTTTVNNGAGDTWAYNYDAAGQLTKATSSLVGGVGQSSQYSYDAAGNLLTLTDGRGKVTTFSYDGNGNRIKEVDSLGNTITRTFSATNRLLTQTRYTGTSLTATLPSGAETVRYVYDTLDRLRFTVSAQGRVSEVRYNSLGLVTHSLQYGGGFFTVTGALTESTLSSWAAGLPAAQKVQTQLTSFEYDYRGNLIKKSHYATVDGTGAGVVDSATDITEYLYSLNGQLLQTIAVTGTGLATKTIQTSIAYDGLGRQISAINNGATTTTTYSGTSVTVANSAAGLTVVSTTDSAGRLTSVSQSGDSTQRITKYYYDAAGRLRMSEDPAAGRNFIFYDHVGRVQAKVNALGATIAYTYDNDGRVLTETQYANRATSSSWFNGTAVTKTSLTIGAAGSDIVVDSANDRTTTSTYDDAGRLATRMMDGGSAITYSYDGESRLLQTKQGALINKYFYDKDGRQVGVLDAERYLTENVYDGVGRLTKTLRYGGLQATIAQQSSADFATLKAAVSAGESLATFYFYDSEGRQVGVVNEQGFLLRTVYDAALNRRQTIQYMTAVTVVAGDTLSSVKSRAGTGQTTTTNFDLYGRVATVKAPDGTLNRTYYDAAGRVVRQVQADGTSDVRATRTRYNAFGEVTGVVGGVGEATLASSPTASELTTAITNYGTRYEMDGAGRKVAELGPNGQKTLLFYNAAGQLTYTVNALGEVANTSYNSFGQVTEVYLYKNRLAAADLAALTTGGSDALLSGKLIGSWNDDLHTYTRYNKLGLVTQTNSNDVITNHTYNSYGQLTQTVRSISAGEDVSTLYNNDLLGRVTLTATDLGGLATLTRAGYDGFGRVVSTTDANGNIVTKHYSAGGSSVYISDSQGNVVSSIEVDALGRTLTSSDGAGNVTRYSYDDVNRIVTVTTPDNVNISTWKTRTGDTLKVVDGNGGVTQYAYTKDGKLDTVTNALGIVTTDNNYDASGRVYETVDGNGVITNYSYDLANRAVLKTLDPSGLNIQTQYQFDGLGRQIQVTEGFASSTPLTTQYVYGYNGKVRQIIVDPASKKLTTTFSYNHQGQVTQVEKGTVSQPSQQVVRYSFDKLGRKIAEQTDPDGLNLTTQYKYDANGNNTRIINANGDSTWFTYNDKNQRTGRIDALGGYTQYQYDRAGNLHHTHQFATPLATTGFGDSNLSFALPASSDNDRRTYSVHDNSGREKYTLTAIDSQSWAVTEAFYDANNNLIQSRRYDKTLSTSAVQEIMHVLSSEKSVITPSEMATALQALGYNANTAGAARVTRYTYDANNRVRFVVDALGYVTETAYDATGRVKSTTQFNALPVLSGDYSQQAINSAVNRSDTQNRTQYFIYDKAGRVRFSVDAAGYVTENIYDALGHLKTTTQFNTALNLPSYTGTTIKDAVDRNHSKNRTTTYSYDSAGRQVRTTLPGWYDVTDGQVYAAQDGQSDRFQRTIALGYDALGNVVSIDTRTGVSSYTYEYKTYDAAGRETNTVDALGYVTQKTYDALGNIKTITQSASSIGVKTSGYWLNSQIAAQTGRKISYTYDALGRKLAAVQPFVSNGTMGSPTTVFSYDTLGNLVKQSELVAGSTSADSYYYYDKLGRQVLAVDPEKYGTATTYNAFGEVAEIFQYGHRTASSVNVSSRPSFNTDHLTDRKKIYSYNALGKEVGQVVNTFTADATLNTKTYNGFGEVITSTDALNGVTRYEYDKLGRTTRIIDVARLVAASAVDPFKQQQLVTPVTDIEYNGFGDQTKITRSASAGRGSPIIVDYQYDTAGNKIAAIDGNRNSVTMKYDSSGRLLEKAQAVSVANTAVGYSNGYAHIINSVFEYDVLGRQTLAIDIVNGQKGGNANAYNGYGELVTERAVWGAATTANASLTSAITTSYTYDNAGRLANTRSGTGYEFFFYDLAGRVTRKEQRINSFVDTSRDRVSEYEYDLLGNMTVQRQAKYSSTTALNENVTLQTPTITQTFNRWGDVLTRTDAAGHTTRYRYNQASQLISETGPSVLAMGADGATAYAQATLSHEYEYDLLGRAIKESYGAMNNGSLLGVRSTVNTYDAAGQLTKSVNPVNDTIDYAYDIHGNQVGMRNGVGAITVNKYDNNNQLLGRYILRMGGNAAYTSAGSGTPTEVALTQYQYDQAGRRYAETDYAGNTQYDRYDARGNKFESRNIYGGLRNYTYDALGHLTAEIDTVTTSARTYSAGHLDDASTTLTSTTETVTRNSWTYAETDYIVGRQASHSAGGKTYDLSYNGFGQLSKETDRAEPTVRYLTYDYWENGLTKSIKEFDIASETKSTEYSYDIRGNRTVETNKATGWTAGTPNQSATHTTLYQYDALNRIQAVSAPQGTYKFAGNNIAASSNLQSLTTLYDEWGNRRAVSSTYTVPNGVKKMVTEWYDHDAANRVIVEAGMVSGGKIVASKSSDGTAAGTAYSYDAAGRRVTEERWTRTISGTSEEYLQNILSFNDIGLVTNNASRTFTRSIDATTGNTITSTTNVTSVATIYGARGLKVKTIDSGVGKSTDYTYNSDGTLNSQVTKINSSDKVESDLKSYTYDSLGNVSGYRYTLYDTAAANGTVKFVNGYNYLFDNLYSGRQVTNINVYTSTSGSNSIVPGTTYNGYDVRGRLTQSRVFEVNATTSVVQDNIHLFAYNADDKTIAKEQIIAGGTPKVQSYYYVRGNQLAEIGELKVNLFPQSAVYTANSAPTSYVVNENDSLMSIAKAVYGDANLWYLIADANGLAQGPSQPFAKDQVGRSLRIPTKAKEKTASISPFTAIPQTSSSAINWSDIVAGSAFTPSLATSGWSSVAIAQLNAANAQASGQINSNLATIATRSKLQKGEEPSYPVIGQIMYGSSKQEMPTFLSSFRDSAPPASSAGNWSMLNPGGAYSPPGFDWKTNKERAGFADLVLGVGSQALTGMVMASNPFASTAAIELNRNATWGSLKEFNALTERVIRSEDVLGGVGMLGKASFVAGSAFTAHDALVAYQEKDNYGLAKAGIDTAFSVWGLVGGVQGFVGSTAYSATGMLLDTPKGEEFQTWLADAIWDATGYVGLHDYENTADAMSYLSPPSSRANLWGYSAFEFDGGKFSTNLTRQYEFRIRELAGLTIDSPKSDVDTSVLTSTITDYSSSVLSSLGDSLSDFSNSFDSSSIFTPTFTDYSSSISNYMDSLTLPTFEIANSATNNFNPNYSPASNPLLTSPSTPALTSTLSGGVDLSQGLKDALDRYVAPTTSLAQALQQLAVKESVRESLQRSADLWSISNRATVDFGAPVGHVWKDNKGRVMSRDEVRAMYEAEAKARKEYFDSEFNAIERKQRELNQARFDLASKLAQSDTNNMSWRYKSYIDNKEAELQQMLDNFNRNFGASLSSSYGYA